LVPQKLAALAKVTSPRREESERRILKAFGAYQAELNAVRLSPTKAKILDAIKVKHDEIGKLIALLNFPIPELHLGPKEQQRGARRSQFRSVLADLLDQKGHTLDEYRDAALRALTAVRAYDRVNSELLATVEHTLDDGLFLEVSEKGLRYELFRTLHRILIAMELPSDTGAKSLLIFLIIELEGKSLRDAFHEESYRKSLADKVTEAVKGKKGG
jgi:hypothetical protein